jgi:folylpolyglutamate synthase/dihydropteroate synthase
MSYKAAVDHLYARGLELATSRRKFELEHMRTLARALGDPQTRFPSVLIAGTNGKGSTAATLASILTAAGYRTALYTSPHLSRVNERIRIDGQPIPDDDFASLYFQVDTAAEQLVTSGQLPQHPSFFETLTALAFLYFAGTDDARQDPSHQSTEAQASPVSQKTEPPKNRVPHLRGEAAKVGSQNLSQSTNSSGHEQSAFLTNVEAANVRPQNTHSSEQEDSVILSEGEAEVEGSAVRSASLDSAQSTGTSMTDAPKAPPAARVAPVDIAILEVGLGGRLDATNIVEPILSILTDISLDHQEYLGNTIAEITREKAGILRHHGTLITLPQHPEANQAIGEAAASLDLHAINAAQYIPTADKLLHNIGSVNATASTAPGSSFVKGTALAVPQSTQLSEGASAPEVPLPRNRYTVTLAGQPLHIDSPLAGQHQQRNIALAIAAAEELRNPTSYKKNNSNNRSYKIINAQIEEGIRKTLWPGRLELLPLPGSAPILLDVAHNPAGAWTLRAALAQLPEDLPRTLLFSCLRDKDLREMSQILLPLFDRSSPDRPNDHIVLAPIDSPRAASIEDLQAAALDLEVPVETTASLQEALAKARKLTPANGLIVATGSVYLIGELRSLILGHG